MEQVVLHAADDATECRDVQAQDSVAVHAAKPVGDAGRCTQDGEEQAMIARVLPELLVDQVQVSIDQADGVGTDPADVLVLLQQQEQFEQRRRILCEHLVMARLQVTVLDLESLVQWLRLGARIHEDLFLEQLQQHFVQPAQVHDRAVVALHQLLDSKRITRVFVTEHLCEPGLVIEEQPVLATSGQHVQAVTHTPQECLPVFQEPQLPRREKLVCKQLVEGVNVEMPLGNPADHLDVTEPTGTPLDVGFEFVRGVVVTMMARELLGAFRLEEAIRRPDFVGRDRLPHFFE